MRTLASELRTIAHGLSEAPRVYVDANMPAGVVTAMRQSFGWDVLFVVEHDDLRRASDRSHFARAQELGRTLLTLDRDFSDPRRFPAESGPGVIICSAPDERILIRMLRYIDRTLLRGSTSGLPLQGRTIILTPDVITSTHSDTEST
jgi:predicted nuclease of predicted toxin-antitoxin system